jgi:hypothetical protein
VRDELNELDPRLIGWYDHFALINLLQYWHFEGVLLLGSPTRFWRRAGRSRRHPFFHHPVLARHGGELAAEARRRATDRAREKGLTNVPVAFGMQAMRVMFAINAAEARRHDTLVALAKRAAAGVWGIEPSRFDAAIQGDVANTNAFGPLRMPRTIRGHLFRAGIIGYGGVTRNGDQLVVTARANNFLTLAKELVKGTAELICLHGMNQLEEDTYRRVVRVTDRLEFEPWMLQTGGELWRRLLAVTPDDWPMAEVLMHLSRLPADALETTMLAVLEKPVAARERLARLC